MKLLKLMFVFLFIVLYLFSSSAKSDSMSIDYIRGEGDVEGVKIAYQFYFDVLEDIHPDLVLYMESSVNFWEYGTPRETDTNFVFAVSPAIRYSLCECLDGRLYGEFGIGISILDDTQFAGKNVSTHYQFEDRLGIGYRFGRQEQYSIALRYFHYSNAGIKRPNPGLDFVSLSFALKL